MYIFELINKLKNRKGGPEFYEGDGSALKEIAGAEAALEDEIEDASTCEHVFMPIDSTKTILACSKCGFVIKNSKAKFSELDKNPFK